jgi:hypothetical protein
MTRALTLVSSQNSWLSSASFSIDPILPLSWLKGLTNSWCFIFPLICNAWLDHRVTLFEEQLETGTECLQNSKMNSASRNSDMFPSSFVCTIDNLWWLWCQHDDLCVLTWDGGYADPPSRQWVTTRALVLVSSQSSWPSSASFSIDPIPFLSWLKGLTNSWCFIFSLICNVWLDHRVAVFEEQFETRKRVLTKFQKELV